MTRRLIVKTFVIIAFLKIYCVTHSRFSCLLVKRCHLSSDCQEVQSFFRSSNSVRDEIVRWDSFLAERAAAWMSKFSCDSWNCCISANGCWRRFIKDGKKSNEQESSFHLEPKIEWIWCRSPAPRAAATHFRIPVRCGLIDIRKNTMRSCCITAIESEMNQGREAIENSLKSFLKMFRREPGWCLRIDEDGQLLQWRQERWAWRVRIDLIDDFH